MWARGGLLEPPGDLLGISCEPVGASWRLLGRPWGLQACLWGLLRTSWGSLGTSWGPLGCLLGHLGISWGPLVAFWGRLWPTRCSRARKAAQGEPKTAPGQRPDSLYVVKDMISSSIYILTSWLVALITSGSVTECSGKQSWGPFGGHLLRLWHLWDILGVVRGPFGGTLDSLGVPWFPLGCFSGSFGVSWGSLGGTWGILGFLGDLWEVPCEP